MANPNRKNDLETEASKLSAAQTPNSCSNGNNDDNNLVDSPPSSTADQDLRTPQSIPIPIPAKQDDVDNSWEDLSRLSRAEYLPQDEQAHQSSPLPNALPVNNFPFNQQPDSLIAQVQPAQAYPPFPLTQTHHVLGNSSSHEPQLQSNNPFLKGLNNNNNNQQESPVQRSSDHQSSHLPSPPPFPQNWQPVGHKSQPPENQTADFLSNLSLNTAKNEPCPLQHRNEPNNSPTKRNPSETTTSTPPEACTPSGVATDANNPLSPAAISEDLISFSEGEVQFPTGNLQSSSQSQAASSSLDHGKPTEMPGDTYSTNANEPERRISIAAGSLPPPPPLPSGARHEQLNSSETYDIRIANWKDGASDLRLSPILVQNENGPCPLLALVNGLVLRSPPGLNTPLIRALWSRERISLGLLMQALFDELVSSASRDSEIPDVDDLSRFLTMLHTGMNVNPRLTPTMDPPTPGTFQETRDAGLYSSFNLPLVHGWTAPPTSPAHEAMLRVAEYHDDIQLLHFQKEELEAKVFRGGSLTMDEQQLAQDIDNIQRFVMDNVTQLSAFGLQHLNRSLKPGSISILFRNDHFSTLYKHPLSHQLFTLVTDAGYASHAEIIWESLVDINGTNSELFSGDFLPVGVPASRAKPSTNEPAAAGENTTSDSSSHNEQMDADYAFALSLQYEDEQRDVQEREQNQRNTTLSPRTNVNSPTMVPPPRGISAHSNSISSTYPVRPDRNPTGRRTASVTNQPIRSLVPPHPSANQNDPNAPPPTYEQAAQSPAYHPPPDPRLSGINRYDGSSNNSSRPSTHISQGYNPSTYNPHRHSPGHDVPNYPTRRRPQSSMQTSSYTPREKDRNKDCIVM
ncbi:hypothetical protein FQN57_001336 [Myotisia sp. PD_48]|nr:hypothetical protein FQN57_001336 [Myotisia sp. PD_48]